MKKPLIIGAFVFMFLMTLLIFIEFGSGTNYVSAQKSEQNQQGRSANSPENEIRTILENYYRIAETNDRNALKKFSKEISAPELVLSNELGKMDKAAAFRLFEEKNIQFISSEFDDLTVQIYGETAVAKYRDKSVVRVNGDLIRTPMRFTNVWVNRGGRWQIVAEHSSLITS